MSLLTYVHCARAHKKHKVALSLLLFEQPLVRLILLLGKSQIQSLRRLSLCFILRSGTGQLRLSLALMHASGGFLPLTSMEVLHGCFVPESQRKVCSSPTLRVNCACCQAAALTGSCGQFSPQSGVLLILLAMRDHQSMRYFGREFSTSSSRLSSRGSSGI